MMTEFPNFTSQLNTTLETILSDNESGYLFRILSPVIMIPFGIIGNTLILIILMQKRYNKVSTFYYMKALAVSDNIVMAMFFVRWLNKLPNSVVEHDRWFCMFYFFFIRLGFGISAWTLLLMSFDRYQLVRKPLKAYKYCTINRARLSLLVVTIIYIIVHLPHFWRTADPKGTTLQSQCPYQIPKTFTKPYSLVRIVVFDRFLPWILSLGFALAMSYELYKHRMVRKTRLSINTDNSRSKKVTRMTIYTNWVFFLLTFPYSIYLSISTISPSSEPIVSPVTYEALAYLLYLNSAINFYLYIIASKSFRRDVLNLLARIVCSKRFRTISTLHTTSSVHS